MCYKYAMCEVKDSQSRSGVLDILFFAFRRYSSNEEQQEGHFAPSRLWGSVVHLHYTQPSWWTGMQNRKKEFFACARPTGPTRLGTEPWIANNKGDRSRTGLVWIFRLQRLQ